MLNSFKAGFFPAGSESKRGVISCKIEIEKQSYQVRTQDESQLRSIEIKTITLLSHTNVL